MYSLQWCVMGLQVVGAVYNDWPQLLLLYKVLWSILCQFIPLLILIVCNVCLTRAIRQSRELHRRCRASFGQKSTTSSRSQVANATASSCTNQRLTPTLIALIIVYIICVSPSAFLFIFNVVGVGDATSSSETTYFVYHTAGVIANCLFLVNFAANFVLYCVVNVRFRCMAREVLCCACSTTSRHTAPLAASELLEYTSRRSPRRNDEWRV